MKYLEDEGVKIWSANADAHGSKDLGPIYGKQFRSSGPKEIDQVQYCLELLRNDPHLRRIVISLWNPSDAPDGALPCCHGTAIQFFMRDENVVDLQMYQRSADVALGLPYNISSYSLFLIMMCHCADKVPGNVIITLGDTHVYEQHFKPAHEQISRLPYPFPTLKIKPGVKHNDPANFEFNDFVVENYHFHPKIKYEFVV